MMPNKIGFIDSGIGGLNILKKYLQKMPNNNYIYYGDTAHLPYGSKTKEELLEYSTKIIKFLINRGVNTIVLACGTLCSLVYDDLINIFPNIKIINIIDNACENINKTNYKKIGLIATENTIKKGRFANKLKKEVLTKSTPMFVPIIENREEDKYNYYINYYLNDLKDVDALVLGCTHYLFLKKEIEKYLHKPIIDMSDYLPIDIYDSKSKSLDIYFSKITPYLSKNIKEIIGNYHIKKMIL